MFNKRKPIFENHFLNTIDSIEVNLHIWRQHNAFFPASSQGIHSQNPGLNCGSSVDKALEEEAIPGKTAANQAEKLNDRALQTKRMQGLAERLQTVSEMLDQQTADPQKQAILQEYQQLADHIIPTLARITQRAEARRTAVGIPITPKKLPAADETLNVALRAALKRRG